MAAQLAQGAGRQARPPLDLAAGRAAGGGQARHGGRHPGAAAGVGRVAGRQRPDEGAIVAVSASVFVTIITQHRMF